jgi:hypothetical protein
MMRVVAAELRRIVARRLVRLSIVLALAGIFFGGVAAFAWSDSLAQTEYDRRVAEAAEREQAMGEAIEACLRSHGVERDAEVSEEVADACFPEKGVSIDDPRFHRRRLEGVLMGVSGALAVIGWALGASLVGAEFASRSMTTALTWEPRRTRLFLAKATAALATMTGLALVTLSLVVLAMTPSLVWHGAPLEPNDPTWVSLAGTIGRGVLLTALAAGMGFAIATIGRNTAAALGAGFAYVIVLENILGSSFEQWRRWLLLGNVIVLIAGENDAGDIPGRTVVGAGTFLAVVAVTLLIAAAASFRTRDIA